MYHSKSPNLSRPLIISLLIVMIVSSVSAQWFRVNSSSTYRLGSIIFINDLTGFVTGKNYGPFGNFQGEILRTTDGGNTWIRVLHEETFRPVIIRFTDQQTGYAAGGFYASQLIIYKTTDSGSNWFSYLSNGAGGAVTTLSYQGGSLFYAGGYEGRFLISTNSALNWSIVSSVNFNPIDHAPVRSFYFSSSATGWMVGDSNVVYKTTNGGLNWNGNQTTSSSYFYAIQMLNGSIGLAAGTNGVVQRTINGGNTWQGIPSGVNQRLTSMYFPDGSIGFIVGDNGTILRSTDAGLNWVIQNSGTIKSLYSVYFINALTGFAVGDTGEILKTTNGGVIGIIPISNEIPETFSLSQNFPNPFNPSTRFKIQIRSESDIKVAIYDIRGTEIGAPVNMRLNPGSYEMEWNGAAYSSGIYFCRLTAKTSSLNEQLVFEATRKMVLSK